MTSISLVIGFSQQLSIQWETVMWMFILLSIVAGAYVHWGPRTATSLSLLKVSLHQVQLFDAMQSLAAKAFAVNYAVTNL